MTTHLPAVYRVLIGTNGLFEGFVVTSDAEHYVVLWGEGEDEVATHNAEIEVHIYAPGRTGQVNA